MNNLPSNTSESQDREKHSAKGRNPLMTLMGLAIATAMGATLGLLFAPKSGEELQADMKEKAQEVADEVTKRFHKSRAEVQKTVQNIFGEVNEELEKDYLKIRGQILAEMSSMQDKAALTQKKYEEIVKDTVEQFAEGKKWSDQTLQNLQNDFMESWDGLKDIFHQKKNETKQKANNVKNKK